MLLPPLCATLKFHCVSQMWPLLRTGDSFLCTCPTLAQERRICKCGVLHDSTLLSMAAQICASGMPLQGPRHPPYSCLAISREGTFPRIPRMSHLKSSLAEVSVRNTRHWREERRALAVLGARHGSAAAGRECG